MKQKKLLTMLALLLMVAAGAWADESSESFTTTSRATSYTGEHFKISLDKGGDDDGFILKESAYATIEALNGEIITKVEFTCGLNSIADLRSAVGTITLDGVVAATVSGVNATSLAVNAVDELQIKAVKVYYGDAAPTTYNITLDEGTGNKDSQNWEITPKSSELGGGEDVTVKYNGSREVKSVTVVKKAAATDRALAKATAEDLGKIAGADGKIYATKADAETAGTTAVAMIAYVGSDTGNDTYTHGMALALSDEGEMNWSNAKSTCEGKSAVSGAAWLLPSRNQWKTMFKANGGSEESYDGLNTAVATAGGDSSKLQKNERYWSSSELDSDFAWVLVIGEDSAGWDGAPEDLGHHVRACLAF